jgi:acetyltransferase-like isoleucine patch superfamily enzyme
MIVYQILAYFTKCFIGWRCILERANIGMSAVLIQGIKIGKWVTTIGAGNYYKRTYLNFAVVVGNPGKIINIIYK